MWCLNKPDLIIVEWPASRAGAWDAGWWVVPGSRRHCTETDRHRYHLPAARSDTGGVCLSQSYPSSQPRLVSSWIILSVIVTYKVLLEAKTILLLKKNLTQNKSQTQRARSYEVTSCLSTDCSKNVYSLGPWSPSWWIFYDKCITYVSLKFLHYIIWQVFFFSNLLLGVQSTIDGSAAILLRLLLSTLACPASMFFPIY